MSTKHDNLTNPASCLNKAADDEPLFILRAKDPCAPEVVMHWVNLSKDMHDYTKRGEALEVAKAMREWRLAHAVRSIGETLDDDQRKRARDLVCDVVTQLVTVGEALGLSVKIQPVMGLANNAPNAAPQQLVHVAHVETDPGSPAQLTAEQYTKVLRDLHYTAEQLAQLAQPNAPA